MRLVARAASCDSGSAESPRPAKRNDSSSPEVNTSASATMCTVWMVGIIQVLAWMVWLGAVVASHSPN